MELTSHRASPSLALGPRTSLLAERAITLLADGPADPSVVIREICQISAVPHGLADHLAVACLAGDARFARRLDGRWELAPIVTPAAPTTIDALRYVVVDVEATGTRIDDGDRITEVAVVEVHDGRSEVVFDSLINPGRPIPAMITSLTGITRDMVRMAPRFDDIALQLAGVLEGRIFVAHNASFDWRFLSAEMQRATGRPLAGNRLCTVRMARRLVPTLRRRSLDAVAHFFGITITNRHRAGGDAIATAKVLRRLLAAAHDCGIATLDELQAHLRAPRRPRTRPPAMPHASDGVE